METSAEIQNQSKRRQQATVWCLAKTDTSETCTTLCFPQNNLFVSHKITKNRFLAGLCCIKGH